MVSSSSSTSKTPAKTNVNVNPGPPPSSARGTNIPFNPVNPLLVGYNFSQTTEHSCLVRQDYTIIDQFAKDCRLQKLWTIHKLLHALGKLSEEYDLAKADQNALQNQVQIVGNDIAQDDAAGKTIKLHLVEIQAAYAPLANNVKAVDDQIKPLDGEVSSLKREQFAAVIALASQSSKTTGDDTKKLQAAVNALFGVNA
ncbi:hypothetical protein ABVK25_011739 [Lepraria finkii]|uniref:Uncharacterized protein n=1 Tax=Lepraria finkii TaxID=1340010 RepID=A0ABR4AM05_9LECA